MNHIKGEHGLQDWRVIFSNLLLKEMTTISPPLPLKQTCLSRSSGRVKPGGRMCEGVTSKSLIPSETFTLACSCLLIYQAVGLKLTKLMDFFRWNGHTQQGSCWKHVWSLPMVCQQRRPSNLTARTLSQLFLIKGMKAIHKSSECCSRYTDSQRPPSASYSRKTTLLLTLTYTHTHICQEKPKGT